MPQKMAQMWHFRVKLWMAKLSQPKEVRDTSNEVLHSVYDRLQIFGLEHTLSSFSYGIPEGGIAKILDTCTSIKRASLPKMLYGVNYYGPLFCLAEMGTAGSTCSSGASLLSMTAAMVARTLAPVASKIGWARALMKLMLLLF
jgi:hypothetical protein